ncbi:sulfatase-like hydrolase/transferase [Pontiella agarivorans]|uniref:Sulfatase-like hydrolase/transferase n=1 Tax=Pontiella agarivorans TaxID=3038953 RepID=A0ABU5MTM4_9BACT|nr:sulfatase-like hydrolase/transferase [Pontiella agarivorans]MDZ8117574.1 sulfatase-like hydrolase/transferase [Pontiella agarivorans]
MKNTWKLMLWMLALAGSAAANEQPNILWIITDDHRADSVQAYNRATTGKNYNPLGFVMSPEADKLAEEGVLFTRAYCNSPGCAPSRTSMHYGMYPHHSGHYGFETSHRDTAFSKPFLPEMMADLGYTTASFGKTGFYVFKNSPRKYDKIDFYQHEVSMRQITDSGLSDWSKYSKWAEGKKAGSGVRWRFKNRVLDYYIPVDGEMDAENARVRKQAEEELDILYAYKRNNAGLIIGGQSPSSAENTMDGHIAGSMIDFLQHAGKKYNTPYDTAMEGPNPDKPLFVHLGFHFPHTPTLPSKEFRDLFMAKEKEIPYRVPDFSKEELEKLPPQMQLWFEKTNFADMTEADKRQSIRDYYAFCAMGDHLVGQSVEAFKAYSRKQGRDWLILYVIGDHGWHLGEQGGTSKFAPYDKSNHCAVIAVSSDKQRWPAGKVCRNWVEFVDIAPTLLQGGGADLSEEAFAHLDGVSMKDVLAGKNTRQYVIGEMNHVIGPRCYLRCDDFAFSMRNREKNGKAFEKWGDKPGVNIKWALEAPREKVEMVLFDLRVDSGEQNNVAYDPEYAALADWFRNKLGRITLGDGRVECDWKHPDDYMITDFAKGAHDGKLDIPAELIPTI